VRDAVEDYINKNYNNEPQVGKYDE